MSIPHLGHFWPILSLTDIVHFGHFLANLSLLRPFWTIVGNTEWRVGIRRSTLHTKATIGDIYSSRVSWNVDTPFGGNGGGIFIDESRFFFFKQFDGGSSRHNTKYQTVNCQSESKKDVFFSRNTWFYVKKTFYFAKKNEKLITCVTKTYGKPWNFLPFLS